MMTAAGAGWTKTALGQEYAREQAAVAAEYLELH